MMCTLGSCSSSVAPVKDKVKVQLKYRHQAQFAGLYVAVKNGYYQEEDIEVEFIEGGGGVDLFGPVISQDIHFAIASSDHILAKRVEGAPLKAIAAIYRKSATVFVSMVGSQILRPHDMKNKKVAALLENAGEYEFQLKAMLKNVHIDPQEVQVVSLDRQYKDFISGKVDVTGAYITGGALRLEAQGVELNYIWPSDYGIEFYSDTLFTSDHLITTNPDLVLRFLRASLRGWNEAIRHQTEAIEATLEYAKIKDTALQTAMMNAQHHLIYTGDAPIGWMSKRVWQGMNRTLHEQGVITTQIQDINTVFTTKFLEAIYNDN